MRRRILPRLLAVGILVLTLAGCVRFQADLAVSPTSTVSGTIVVGILNSDDTDEGRETARASADEVITALLGGLKDAEGVSVSDYASDDDYVGYELLLSDVPFEAFSGTEDDSLRFANEDGQIVFTGALDFTDQSTDTGEEGDGDDSNLTISIAFPGAVTEHNGELSGNTVSWRTTLEERLEMSARSTIATGLIDVTPFLVVGGVFLLLVVVAIVVVVLVLRGRGKKTAAVPAAPATDAVAPPAQDPAAPTT